MRSSRPVLRRVTVTGTAMLLTLLWLPHKGAATLAGDVNGDQVVDASDVDALIVRLFDASFVGAPAADVNQDQLVTVADITITDYAAAGVSPPPTNTPAPPTTTRTPTATGTSTSTPVPTATPTATACVPQDVVPGTITGALESGDCAAPDNGGRPSDVYAVAANPGQAMSVQITANGFTPVVTVTDPGVYFEQATAPVEFLVTTTRPYQIEVSSVGAAKTGSYSLVVSVRNCPTAVRAVVPTAGGKTISTGLRDDDCPDPFEPDTPAHRYTFTAQAGKPVQIDMNVSGSFDAFVPDPFLSLYGPAPIGALTGYFLGCDDSTGGFLDNGSSNASLFFYPLETGTYTIVASGAGLTGSYAITFSLPACAPTPAAASSTPTVLDGTLTGTSCPAPPPLPDATKTEPDGRADLWTVDLNAGDVLGAKLISVDLFDTQLYVLDPNQALLAADDDGSEDGGFDSQLAFTAPQTGTYTVVAASNEALATQDDSTVAYQLELQRCPARPLAFDSPTQTSFQSTDCRGSDGAHFNSYRLNATGAPGQFVTVTMQAGDPTLDSVLSLVGPNGVRVDNDDDPLLDTTDARVSQALVPNGVYFLTATSFASSGTIEADFALWAQRCRTIPLTGTQANGEFRDEDCSLFLDGQTTGPKINVFTLTTAADQMLSVVPPDVGCALAVTPDGVQGPGPACLTDDFEMPLVGTGTTAVMVVAPDSSTRTTYTFPVTVCPTQLLNFNSPVQPGFISSTDCRDALGNPADSYVFRAPRGLTTFNGGNSGRLVPQFLSGSVSIDDTGTQPIVDEFATQSQDMWPIGTDLVTGLVVRSSTAGGGGAYEIEIDPPFFH
ncbi:MAG TPA: pre-peptidase C-terminal domain-containing protein [Candidatus Kryptonia bacterium]|nr:pre-peptidase C-terminal domain-containing protein [Candidatus Kryptonia bacterium]